MELELGLDPDDAARLPRLAFLAPLKDRQGAHARDPDRLARQPRSARLAQQGLALAEQRPVWRLERLHPNAESWPPGAPAPVLASRSKRVRSRHARCPIRWCRWRHSRAAHASLALVSRARPGRADPARTVPLRAVAAEHRVSRIVLEGADAAGARRCARAGRRTARSPCRGPAWQRRRLRHAAACLRRRATKARPNCPPDFRSPPPSPMSSAT